MTWMDDALCKGMDSELFFEPDRDEFPDRVSWQMATQAKLKEARALCKGCPVINQCLRANLATPFGVFGGMSTLQRRTLARKHGLSVSDDTLRKENAPMGPERIKVIVDLRHKGHSIVDIASLTGINRFTVSRILNDPANGGPGKKRKTTKHGYRFQKSWNDPKYARIREMLAEGHTAKHIGRETGFCWRIVQRIRYTMEEVQAEMELAK